MNEKIKQIYEKIKEYDRIILFRHIRPDADAVGANKGLAALLKLNYPEKEIYLQNCDFSKYTEFLGAEDAPIADGLYGGALGIVCDTANQARISNPKYQLCEEIVKIDHHIPVDNYGDIQWVEEHRSSCCEMIAAFYDELSSELKMNSEIATYIYAGMVTDSGRFKFNSVSGETMRLAGIMISQGIDTDTLFANLYLKDIGVMKFESHIGKKMKISESGVASVYITQKMQKDFGISGEDASEASAYMESIKGSLIWIAFVENPDGSIRVRLRSRFIAINALAEKYGGGGHACACGATIHSKKEMNALIDDADAMLKEYKATYKGWM